LRVSKEKDNWGEFMHKLWLIILFLFMIPTLAQAGKGHSKGIKSPDETLLPKITINHSYPYSRAFEATELSVMELPPINLLQITTSSSILPEKYLYVALMTGTTRQNVANLIERINNEVKENNIKIEVFYNYTNQKIPGLIDPLLRLSTVTIENKGPLDIEAAMQGPTGD
jgi:hypothetical protein